MKKTIILVSLIAAMIIQPATAKADRDKALAAIGGFVGGIVTSHIIHKHQDHHDRGHTKVVVREKSYHRDQYYEERGHYEYRRVKAWVPGCWVRSYDDCGRPIKVWQKGHYTYKKKKVWVENYPRYKSRSRASYCSRW